jgi:hypothetical protein
MDVDEGRRGQAALRVDHAASFARERRLDRRDAAAANADVQAAAAVGKRRIAHDQVEAHRSPFT